MKLKDWCVFDLKSRGLWEQQATAVVQEAKDFPTLLSVDWEKDTDDYTAEEMDLIKINLDFLAVTWIDKNMPKHWARLMFAKSGTSDGDLLQAMAFITGNFKNETKDFDNFDTGQ